MIQSHYFQANTVIPKIERAGALDRYGQAQLETVYIDARGRLEKRTRFVRTSSGDTLAIDATLTLSKSFDLKTGDIITDSAADQWTVFTVDEILDVAGAVQFRRYGLTKKD